MNSTLGVSENNLTLPVLLIIAISLFSSDMTFAAPDTMKCETGPVKKIYGNVPWLVYSCTDNKTVVIVSDTGSPAMPFVFSFHKKDDGYHLIGEGTGNKNATNAAYTELSKLTEMKIQQLITQTINNKTIP